MSENESKILDFDEWFKNWFSNSLVDSLGILRSELAGISEKIREIRLLCPALDESLDENAAAQAVQDQRLRPPSELVDLLGQLSIELIKLHEMGSGLVTPQRELEILRRELAKVLGKST